MAAVRQPGRQPGPAHSLKPSKRLESGQAARTPGVPSAMALCTARCPGIRGAQLLVAHRFRRQKKDMLVQVPTPASALPGAARRPHLSCPVMGRSCVRC